MSKLFAIIAITVLVLLTVSITTLANQSKPSMTYVKTFMYEDIDNVCYVTTNNNGISCLPRVRPMVSSSSSSSEGIKRGTSNAHLNGNFPNNNIPNLNSSALDSSSSSQNSSSESSIQ